LIINYHHDEDFERKGKDFMKRFFMGTICVLMILVLSCGAVWGQATAQISGTVRDQSGVVLPGVEITATQTETGITRNAVAARRTLGGPCGQ
jgi:hypothetical protein